METISPKAKRFKIALSFAGERRAFVADIAQHLSTHLGKDSVLYDHYYEAEFARPDLDTYLQRLYHDESELIAVFLCEDYEKKEWCGLEWRAVKDLIKKRQAADIMPLRFDNTEIPGLFSTDGYVWIDTRSPQEIAKVILARLGITAPVTQAVTTPDKIDLTHLPAGAEHFLGRIDELAALDAAWASSGHTAIVELIAPGGVGKTSLVKRWLEKMKHDNWRGANRVYGWSFYSQGTRDDKQASEDHFLAEALAWFGVAIDPAANPWDKGRELAKAVVASRTLLVLDGIEPLQYPPGPLAGELHAPGLKALFEHLASAGQSGLCLVTSRVQLENLNQYECNTSRPEGVVQRLNLGNLTDTDGARLLHTLGTNKAGAADIDAEDAELRAASSEVQGHALTLSLLGRYIALAYEGDVRRRDQVKFEEADKAIQGGHAFKVMAAYETWFASSGKRGESVLAALRLFGFFDRPASIQSLRALRAAPAIQGLTRPLVNLDVKDWRAALKRLEQCGLIFPVKGGDAYDAHPLVREYMAQMLKQKLPAAWKEGHKRIYEQLKDSVPHRPDGLAGLQPLYQAVSHGCLAGLHQKACDEVYKDRILHGTGHDGFYSTKKLGAIGADLGAIACFFVDPWQRLAPVLSEANQAWLLSEAAFRLRALGRLEEALDPMHAGVERAAKQEDWKNTAAGYGNLSELQLSLGRVLAAVANAKQSLDYAEQSGDTFSLMRNRSILADALHQHGETETATTLFTEAEALQAERQPQYPQLSSVWGLRYCDLLLAGTEQAAWAAMQSCPVARTNAAKPKFLGGCAAVAERAAQTLKLSEYNNTSLLDIALGHLTLARCALYTTLLQGQPSDATIRQKIDTAVTSLRASGSQHHLPRGLLTHAWLCFCQGDEPAARADLDEAERIASRGNMRLHLADIHLTRARLFRDRDALRQARTLIEQCEYFRRLPELEDAEMWGTAWSAAA